MTKPIILCDCAGMANDRWLECRAHGPKGDIPYTVGGSDVAAMVNRKVLSKGVRISVEEDRVSVDISLMVKYGYVVPDVARGVQDAVSSAVENTSGLQVACVNVTVAGVMFQK